LGDKIKSSEKRDSGIADENPDNKKTVEDSRPSTPDKYFLT
jgi:hypothetical protein